MTQLSFQEAAERVKAGIDIIDIVQRHVILKKSGRNYTGKCPFHNDKNPSMQVSREKNVFKCFSCGVGGDALSFLMRIENKTYGEVIRELAQEQGIEILYEGRNPEAAAAQKDAKQKILELNQAATQWFQSQLDLPAGQTAANYLLSRYPDAEMLGQALERFQVGYAPEGWEHLTPYLKEKFDFVRANPDLLVEAGLASSREYGQGHYDRFRNRLIIPIHNEKGQVVAFGGRALSDEDKPKYLNSPETMVYHKSQVLYGLYQAKDAIRQNKAAIVMEGYFDVMTAHLAGITEAVGSCGTAMTESHLKLLTRFGAETVYLAFDSDEAGLKAALSAIALIENYLETTNIQVRVLTVPGGKDPDEFLRQQGKAGGEAFRELLKEARPYLAFKLDMAIRGLDVRTPEGRIQAAEKLTPVLAAIQRYTVRLEYLRQYAEKVGLSEEALLLEVKRYEQSQRKLYYPNFGQRNNFSRNQAISKHAPTSLQRNQPLLTENLSQLRKGLASRQSAAEKNLLCLALYSTESLTVMMSVVDQESMSFSIPTYRQIWHDLSATFAGLPGDTAPASADDGFLGTLIDKMNHLYFETPDVRDAFAELILTAESFGDSLGLGDLSGAALREKVAHLTRQLLEQLRRCNQLQQLQSLK
ncbi:MAG TPA: DNA primase, partial [Oculatellaceae cyanobacterium]